MACNGPGPGHSAAIKVLEAADLVVTCKVGRERRCSINPAGMANLEGFAKLQRDLWAARFSALRNLLEAE